MSTPAEQWAIITQGYEAAGNSMPIFGGLAWNALPDGDPVKLAAEMAAELGVWEDVKRHGPSVARALHEMRGPSDL